MSQKQRKIESGPLTRSMVIDPQSVNEDHRTVEVAFSSEASVQRWFGTEILDHSEGSVRLDRLRNGAAVLVDHDTQDHVGVVESVSIDSDRRGRATVRFGKGARADEVFSDIRDGIRKHISVGYRIFKARHETDDNENESYRVIDWEPYEISVVSVPADPSVGIGRNTGQQEKNSVTISENTPKAPSSENNESTPTEERAMPAPNIQTNTEELVKQERSRINDITALGRKFDLADEATKAVNDGTELEAFRTLVLEKINSTERSAAKPVTHIDATESEMERYSLVRALRAAESGNWDKAGLELEMSIAVAEKVGRDARGFYVPYDIQTRDMSTAKAGGGSDLVGTDHLAGSFVDALREKVLLSSLGADFLPGLVGDVDIPATDGDGTYYWINEGEDGKESAIPTRTVSLKPKTVAGAIPVTRRLIKQSSPSVEAMILRQMQLGAANAIDKAGFVGTGVKDPKGIFNQTGISTVTIAAKGKPTWAELVAFETKLASLEADDASLAYIATAPVIGHCKTTEKSASTARYLLEDGRINGYAIHRKNSIGTNNILFGNFSDVAIGLWGVLDIMPDKAAKAASGGLVMRVFQDVDVAVKQPKSFAKSA